MNRHVLIGRMLGLAIAIAMAASVFAAADYPDCSWNCRSNDVKLTRVYLSAQSGCTPGQTVQAILYGAFSNTTGTSRYDVALLSNLVITSTSGTTVSELNVSNLTTEIPPGTANLPIAHIEFPCGASVELRDIIISWDTKAGGDLSCASRAAKCMSEAQIEIAGTPLGVGFDLTGSRCQGAAVTFVDRTVGGTLPYTSYTWDFGDGTAISSNVNPSHIYTAAGDYTVTLTVVDGATSASASRTITIYEAPTAVVSNGGPYCPGSSIALFASGGTSYSWSGPGGFSSSAQNPTIQNGEAGIYTVTVTNASGCSSLASTNVVIDRTPPVLTLPANSSVACGSSTLPASTGNALASDAIGSSVVVTYADATIPGTCGNTATIQRTWTAKDSCGNTTTGVQTITVVDTTPPSLTISSLTLECDGVGNANAIAAWLQSAVATDLCGAVTVTNNYAGLTPSCPGVGQATVLFEAADACGNTRQRSAVLTIQDTTSPAARADVITIETNDTVTRDVLSNDSDSCSAQLTLVSVSAPLRGTASVIGNSVSYTAPDTAGSDQFTYVIEDCAGLRSTGQVAVNVTSSNHSPVANDAAVTTAEDTPVNLTLTASDTDGDALTYRIVTGPDFGSVIAFSSETGLVSYTPDRNYFGSDEITFEVCDPDGACSTGTVSLTITSVEDWIVAENQSVTTPEDTPLAIQVRGRDEDGSTVEFVISDGPSHGEISGFNVTTGELMYTPLQHFTGTDSFTFKACDVLEEDECAQATVTILVTPVNDAPEAANQTRATNEDTATGFFALAIADPDNTLAELECNCLEPPQHGSVERGPDHTVNYIPDPNYTGQDAFSYIVCDPSGLCDTAIVTVTIGAENDNPSVIAGNQTTLEETPIDLIITHSDPDGDVLNCTASTPAHGSVSPQSGTISGPYPASGTLTYTPEKDYVGVDQIVVRCDDGNGGSDTVTIEITVKGVNDRPVANSKMVTMQEDAPVTITLTATDADGDDLTYAIIGTPNHGTITAFDPATGTLIYTPAQDYSGTDELIFQGCDPSGACDTGVVTITIEPVDDNPIPDPQSVTTAEDVSKAIVLTATEPDGEALTYGIVSGPSHGRITEFDEATGQLTYVPNANYVGNDSFVFEACDPDAGHGCPQASVTITVTPVNDPPTANAQAITTLEERPVGITLTGSDVDGDVLTFRLDQLPNSGQIDDFDPATGAMTYVPNDLFSGSDAFSFSVCDASGACAQASVTITALPGNHAPTANDVAVTMQEDDVTSLLLTGSDPDDDLLVYWIVSDPAHGEITSFDGTTGSLSYRPDPDYNGLDEILFETCDPQGLCDQATIRITVEGLDDFPVAVAQTVETPEDVALAIQVSGWDIDGDPVSYVIVSTTSHGTITGFNGATGELVYTPTLHFSGTDSFVFGVCDGHDDHGCSQETVTILVTPVNDAPEAANQTRATNEDTATGFFALAIADPDNTLAELECNCLEPPQHGSVERGPDHTVNYIPDPNYTGQDAFSYIVCDPSGLCDTAIVTVTIGAENDNPSVIAGNQTTLEETPIDLIITHSDPDGDVLNCTASTPAHGSVSPQSGTISGPYPASGTLTYTPEKDYVGVDQIVVRCDDGNGGSDTVTIEITVKGVNDRPVANSKMVTMQEDAPVTITLTAIDADGDDLTYAIIGTPNHGTITAFDPATGTLIYTPAQDYSGTDELIFQGCDPSGACDTGVVTITIEPVDDNPIPDPQSVTTAEEVSKAIVLTATEPDGEALTYGIVSGPSHGRITEFDEATGQLTYVPNANYVGNDSFVFEACDPDAGHGCPQATVTITVTPVNDPPTAGTAVESTLEDVSFTASLPGNDVDDTALQFRLLSQPSLGGIEGFDPATGRYTYVPTADMSGEDTFEYEVCDASGACARGSISIQVTPVNDAPEAQALSANTFQDVPLVLQLNATDPDSTKLTFSALLLPRYGSFVSWDEDTGIAQYQPAPGFVGNDSFLFSVCDPEGMCDTGFVFIHVLDANDVPVAAYLETTVNQAEPTRLDARATDADGDALTFSIVSEPLHGTISGFDPATGAFVYTSEGSHAGPDLIRYQACDASGACASGVIQMDVVPAGGGGAVALTCPNVVISEVAWAGTSAGEDHEWIELRNLEVIPVRITGWTLRWRALQPETPEDRAWRTIRLSGLLWDAQTSLRPMLSASESVDNLWRVQWQTILSSDYCLIELGSDSRVLSQTADLILPLRDAFGLSVHLPDEGAVIELRDSTGCLVDTANVERLPVDGWAAGTEQPPASMERTNLNGDDVEDNWHTNLGMIRNGWDAFGNLIHGTPGAANSPILGFLVGSELTAAAHPVGEPILIRLDGSLAWLPDPQLWNVVAAQTGNDALLPIEWTIISTGIDSVAVIVQTDHLPQGTDMAIWVRTPTGDIFVSLYVLSAP